VNEMPAPETDARIAKMQKDIEELKEAMRDTWHERRNIYENRVREVLEKYPNCITLWLEIDGVRSLKEIEEYLQSTGQRIPQPTLWRSSKILFKAGLIQKVAKKGRSPVYSKKPWAKELNMDDYVRKTFVEQESET